jgi:hypothetical protein
MPQRTGSQPAPATATDEDRRAVDRSTLAPSLLSALDAVWEQARTAEDNHGEAAPAHVHVIEPSDARLGWRPRWR